MRLATIQEEFRHAVCDICGSNVVRLLGEREYTVERKNSRYFFKHRDVCCQRCGFVYNQLRPSDCFLEGYYRDAFNSYDASIDISVDYSIEKRLVPIQQYVSPGGYVIEVGAASGQFSKLLSCQGYHIEGIDPLDNPNHGQVKKGFIKDNYTPEQKYDAVLSYYVLEHVNDANTWMANIAALVKDGGYVIIEVPEFNRYPGESLNEEHLLHFRREHLELLLKKYRFEVIRHSYPPSRYFGFLVIGRYHHSNNCKLSLNGFNVESFKAEAESAYTDFIQYKTERDDFARYLSIQLYDELEMDPDLTVVIWAANEYSTNIAQHIPGNKERVYIFDNSRTKTGKIHPGFLNRVVLPTHIGFNDKKILFVICSPNWNVEIRRQIEDMKFQNARIISGIVPHNRDS